MKEESLIEYPFCQGEMRAYWWSLARGGKKCNCGAKLNSELMYSPPKGKVFNKAKLKFLKEKR